MLVHALSLTHSYMRKQFAGVVGGGGMGLNAINNNAAATAHKIHVQKPKSTLCANGRPEYVHTHTHAHARCMYTQEVHDIYTDTLQLQQQQWPPTQK